MAETGTSIRWVRAADRLADGEPLRLGPLQLAPILGAWTNTNPRTRGVARFVVSERDGRVWVQAWGGDPDAGSLHDWGEVPVETLYSDGPRSARGCAFTASFDHGHARTLVQTNQNHGVTVLALYTRFTDGSGRQNYFTREFYQREEAGPGGTVNTTGGTTVDAAGLAYSRGDDRLPMLRGPVYIEQIVGRWRNPDQAAGGISDIDVDLRDGQLYARVAGVGPDGLIDWGEVPAELFADISMTGGQRAEVGPDGAGQAQPHYADISSTGGGPAFLASFDHGFLRVELQCRLNLGLLVVAIYSEFIDGSGRPNYFLRPVYPRR